MGKHKFLDDLKKGPCKDCLRPAGYLGPENPKNPLVMTFDHLPGYKKIFNIADAKSFPFWAVVAEIAKCEVVCFPCHKKRENRRKSELGTKAALICAVFQIQQHLLVGRLKTIKEK